MLPEVIYVGIIRESLQNYDQIAVRSAARKFLLSPFGHLSWVVPSGSLNLQTYIPRFVLKRCSFNRFRTLLFHYHFGSDYLEDWD